MGSGSFFRSWIRIRFYLINHKRSHTKKKSRNKFLGYPLPLPPRRQKKKREIFGWDESLSVYYLTRVTSQKCSTHTWLIKEVMKPAPLRQRQKRSLIHFSYKYTSLHYSTLIGLTYICRVVEQFVRDLLGFCLKIVWSKWPKTKREFLHGVQKTRWQGNTKIWRFFSY